MDRAWPTSRTVQRAALMGLAWLAYAGSLDNSFHYDDSHSILEYRYMRDWHNVPRSY